MCAPRKHGGVEIYCTYS